MPVLFFDGVCGLCNQWVDFVIARDEKQRFRFSPLQSEFARGELRLDGEAGFHTLYLLEDGRILERTDAVIRICELLGGIWSLAAIARFVPRPIRDAAYDAIASRRYRWFGRKETCRIPTPEERERFIL